MWRSGFWLDGGWRRGGYGRRVSGDGKLVRKLSVMKSNNKSKHFLSISIFGLVFISTLIFKKKSSQAQAQEEPPSIQPNAPPQPQALIHRHLVPERPGWQKKCLNYGFTYYDSYWNDQVAYVLEEPAALELEEATAELHRLCLEAVDAVVKSERLLELFEIEEEFWPIIRESWERGDPSVYGRYDILYDGLSPPKMLEYNADTPTTLLESGLVQKNWFLESDFDKKEYYQFNQLHESLENTWKEMYLEDLAAAPEGPHPVFHLVCVKDHEEDLRNTQYMAYQAKKAGYQIRLGYMEEIGWNDNSLVDSNNVPIERIYKLYPWEWIFNETRNLGVKFDEVLWIEPPWKIILSNKAILPVLWELFPNHPNLLPAYFDNSHFTSSRLPYVEKPAAGREGEKATIFNTDGKVFEQKIFQATPEANPPFGRMIYQQWKRPLHFEGCNVIFGSWVINHKPAAITIREDARFITDTNSYFRPHVVHKQMGWYQRMTRRLWGEQE